MPNPKMKIKKGDLVEVITGKDRKSQGKVIAVYPETQKVLVEGVNRIKKHVKVGQTTRGAQTGGIVTQEAPIHVSNVMLVDPETKTRTRIGARKESIELPNGRTKQRSVRVSRRTGKDL
jgi:large subunit ribosomal protein L24